MLFSSFIYLFISLISYFIYLQVIRYAPNSSDTNGNKYIEPSDFVYSWSVVDSHQHG